MAARYSIHTFLLILTITFSNFAFAGPTHVNLYIPDSCGEYKLNGVKDCKPRGTRKVKNHTVMWWSCENGQFGTWTKKCGNCVISTTTSSSLPGFLMLDINPIKMALNAGVYVHQKVAMSKGHAAKASNKNCGFVKKIGDNTADFSFNIPKGGPIDISPVSPSPIGTGIIRKK